jgi:hypothetical protein
VLGEEVVQRLPLRLPIAEARDNDGRRVHHPLLGTLSFLVGPGLLDFTWATSA